MIPAATTRDEVRTDAGVAAFGGQRRGYAGNSDAERDHAYGKRDLRRRAHYSLIIFFRPSDSMMPAMRASSSLRNLA